MRPLPRVLRRTAAGLWLALAVVLVFGGPIVGLWYFGGERLLSNVPYGGFDYDTHVSQVWRVLEGLRGWGKTWVYDVQHLAGYPNGTIFDADNKGWEAFTWALVSMGVPQGQAFNLFIITAHLLVSPVVYVSARLFGLRHNSSLVAAGLAVLYWFFDSWIHWEWFVGMVAYAFASYLFLLPFAAFYRWIKERRAWQAVLCAVSMALAHLVHPYTFFLLVGQMGVLYFREAKSLTRGEHAVVWGIAAVTVAFNAVWLGVALSFWHYILDSSLFADTTLDSLLWDMFGLLGDPTAMGVIGNRTGMRFTLLAGACAGLWAWWRRADDRALPFAVGLAVLLALTYLGGYTFFANIQPHRHVGPTGFLAVIPCAGALELARKERLWTRLSQPAIALLVVLAVPAGQHLSRDILYFTERSLPEPRPLMDGQRVYYTMLGYGPHGDFSYGRWQHDELAQWVRDHDTRRSRFLVDGWHVGEQLVWKTKAQIIGGFIWRNLEHSWANFFRLRPQGISTPAELQKYLETYAIEYVIISTPQDLAPWWDKNPLLERVKTIEHVRIYRTKAQPNLFIENNGSIDARTNRIGVSGTAPSENVVIRYHWLETLVCEPDCAIERVPIETDGVGFIRVPAPHPADFAIVNAYEKVADPPPLD